MIPPVISAGDLVGLLERVKAATGPDRELDGLLEIVANGRIAEVGNYLPTGARCWLARNPNPPGDAFVVWVGGSDSPELRIPAYTASIDAALALVERMLPGFVIYSFGNGDLDLRYSDIRAFTGWRCGLAPIGFSIKENPRDILQWPSVHAPTAPLAILAAMLAARSALGEQPEVKV